MIRKKITYTSPRASFNLTCNMLLHYLEKVENPKMLLTLTVPQQVIDMFLRTL